MKNNITLPIALFLLLLCAAACKNCKDEPIVIPPTFACAGGYVPKNDSCVCPVGNYEGYGVCKALRTNEFWGISYDGVCQDTVSIWFNKGMEPGVPEAEFFGRAAGKKRKGRQSSGNIQYFDLPDGDSIVVEKGFLIPCERADGRFVEPSATAKFTHPDTLKMTLYWSHVHFPFPILDTCHIVFHR